MLRQILAISCKEIKLLLQHPGSLIVVFLVPLVFIFIMGSVFGGGGVPVLAVYAVDQDQTELSQTIMAALADAPNLDVTVLDTAEEADDRISTGKGMAAVLIPTGFAEAAAGPEGADLLVLVDPAQSERASIVFGLVNQALAEVRIDLEVSRGVAQQTAGAVQGMEGVSEEGQALMETFITTAIEVVVSDQIKDALDNPLVTVETEPAQEAAAAATPPSVMELLTPGYMLMFLYFLLSDLAAVVVRERQRGTLRRILVTPASRSAILVGKALPFFVVGVVQQWFVIGAASLIFGFDLGASLGALWLMIIANALALVGISILVGGVVRTEGQAGGLAILLILVMAVVSGSIWTIIQVPVLKWLTPHFWGLQGLQAVISGGQKAAGVVQPALMLLGIAVGAFAVGAWRFKFD